MEEGYYKTKRVHIFLNGNVYSKAFYIHPRCRLGWNTILDCFSKTLKPNFGAIRVLRTIDGKRVIQSFHDLEHDGKYVACGHEAFRNVKGGYLQKAEGKTRTTKPEYYLTETLSPVERKKYPCLMETMKKGRTIIYVFANGKRSDPKKVVLIKSDFEAWDGILKHIGNILDIPEGVKGMYTVFGQPVCSPYEIQHGGYYVAIPFNAYFRPIKYSITSNSYHEPSPMVTKEVYIPNLKKSTINHSVARRKRMPKIGNSGENSEEKNTAVTDRVQNQIIGSTKVQKTGKDSSNDHQRNKVSQTNIDFLEATYDRGNAIFLNRRKYYLIPDKALAKFGDADKSRWLAELFSDLYRKPKSDCNEEERLELQLLYGAVVGLNIQVSEGIASKTVIKENEFDDAEFMRKLSSISDASQLKGIRRSAPWEKSSRTSLISKDKDKWLRLSIPLEALSCDIHDKSCAEKESGTNDSADDYEIESDEDMELLLDEEELEDDEAENVSPNVNAKIKHAEETESSTYSSDSSNDNQSEIDFYKNYAEMKTKMMSEISSSEASDEVKLSNVHSESECDKKSTNFSEHVEVFGSEDDDKSQSAVHGVPAGKKLPCEEGTDKELISLLSPKEDAKKGRSIVQRKKKISKKIVEDEMPTGNNAKN